MDNDYEDDAVDFGVDVPDEAVGGSPEPQAEAVAEKPKKPPLTQGYCTPTALTNRLNKRFGDPESGEYNTEWKELKPQQMYGWVKNGKDFPVGEEGKHTADGRYQVPIEEAEVWVLAQLEKQVTRKAAKAIKDQAAAEAALAAANAVPEVEADSPDVNVS